MTIRYCQVTHGEQAYAAGHARAIHARDHGDDAGASAAEQICIPDVRLGVIECERAAAFEISTGTKSVIAGSGENDRTNPTPFLSDNRHSFCDPPNSLSVPR